MSSLGTGVAPALPRAQMAQRYTMNAFFNSRTTDPQETPPTGQAAPVPPNWGRGYRVWRRGWMAVNPQSNQMGAVPARRLRVPFLTANNGTVYGLQGSPLTINFIDIPSTTTVVNAFVSLAAFCLQDPNNPANRTPVPLPFSQYAWGAYFWDPANPNNRTIPAGTTSTTLSQTADNYPAIPMVQATTEEGIGMNVGGLLTLLGANSVARPPVGNIIRVDIGVYLTLANGTVQNQFFDDPEMDIDMGPPFDPKPPSR